VKLDFSEAAKWVRRAAELGYARTQLDLGYLCEQGKGVPLDHVAAYMWYKAAADAGEPRAIKQLRSLSSVMTEAQIAQASAAAAKWKMSTSIASGDSRSDPIGISFLPRR
jgi:TPR repeat protein